VVAELAHDCCLFAKAVNAVCRKTSGLRPGAVLLSAVRYPAYGQVTVEVGSMQLESR
jgi:hypothetical protein